MITAEQLKQLTSLKKDAIQGLLEKEPREPHWVHYIKKCRFLGMTNGGEFCYALEYDGRMNRRDQALPRPNKVFIALTPAGSLTAGV